MKVALINPCVVWNAKKLFNLNRSVIWGKADPYGSRLDWRRWSRTKDIS